MTSGQQQIRTTKHDKGSYILDRMNNCQHFSKEGETFKRGNLANLKKKKIYTQFVLTINSSVQELGELFNSGNHLLLGEIQQGNNSEAELLQEVGQLMYIHNGGHQVRVVCVIQVANEKGNFISG